ncbi:MAG: fibronectin type III domain-containing protein [Chloroflexota bacterium]
MTFNVKTLVYVFCILISLTFATTYIALATNSSSVHSAQTYSPDGQNGEIYIPLVTNQGNVSPAISREEPISTNRLILQDEAAFEALLNGIANQDESKLDREEQTKGFLSMRRMHRQNRTLVTESLFEDPVLSRALNSIGEIQVGDNVYRFTEKNLFSTKSEDAHLLNTITTRSGTSSSLPEQVTMSPISSHSLPKLDDDQSPLAREDQHTQRYLQKSTSCGAASSNVNGDVRGVVGKSRIYSFRLVFFRYFISSARSTSSTPQDYLSLKFTDPTTGVTTHYEKRNATLVYQWKMSKGFSSIRYPLRAEHISGRGHDSVKCLTAAAPIPRSPLGLTTRIFPTGVRVNWEDVSLESGYTIYRRYNGNWQRIASVEANSTTYLVTGLSCNSEYNFGVLAYNRFGSSGIADIDAKSWSCPPPDLDPDPDPEPNPGPQPNRQLIGIRQDHSNTCNYSQPTSYVRRSGQIIRIENATNYTVKFFRPVGTHQGNEFPGQIILGPRAQATVSWSGSNVLNLWGAHIQDNGTCSSGPRAVQFYVTYE